MSVANELLNQMKEFIDGKIDPEEFSYDFPIDLIERFDDLENENQTLAALFNDEMPEACSNYEPQEVARRGEPNLLDETQFRRKVNDVYEQALKLIN